MAEICKKILIVDDDKEICELLNMFLTLEKSVSERVRRLFGE